MNYYSSFTFTVDSDHAGQRLDIFLARQNQLESFTRSRVQNLIRSGHVLVDDQQRKSSYRLQAREVLAVTIPPSLPSDLVPEEVPFLIIHEDEDLLVLSKPPGLVVHPSAGHASGTLVHGLLHYCKDLSGISGEMRPGIVHRLDKDTSGLLVVAKNDQTHHALVDKFKSRQVKKIYHAILDGSPAQGQGSIDLPIGRHPVSRKKMAVLEKGGREAVTKWKVLERFAASYSYVEIKIMTGRTHQIRVHMASQGHPVAGDTVYGRKKKGPSDIEINRQCLHAYTLAFDHPRTGERMRFVAPLWPDFKEVLDALRKRYRVKSDE